MTEETTELDLLKTRADKMGIKYHPNIGVESLRKKINDTLNAPEPTQLDIQEDVAVVADDTSTSNGTVKSSRGQLKKEAGKLVRIRVTCMNPNKKEWEGEIFTVSNAVVGTYKKFVPFNSEDGWHVPQIILNALKERKCQIFQITRSSNGDKRMVGKLINEFNVEILPPLTPKELEELSRKQALGHHID